MKTIPFSRIACFCFLLVLMPIDAFTQVDIRDAQNRIVGRLDGNDIRDDRNRIIGRINGNDIRDDHNRLIGRIDGNDIRDDRNRTVGRVNGTPVQVKTVAMLSFFFFRLL